MVNSVHVQCSGYWTIRTVFRTKIARLRDVPRSGGSVKQGEDLKGELGMNQRKTIESRRDDGEGHV